MNILLINHYAGSPLHGMEYRPYYMARAWQKLGHRVRIVAAGFSHVRSRQPPARPGIQREVVDGVEYCWIAAGQYAGNGLGRIRNMMSFVLGLARHGAELARDFAPDVVIASSTYPLDAIPARSIARRHGSRLVHEVHDLWPLSPMELGNMSRWNPFIAVMQFAENFAYSRADKVVSMLPCAEPHMREHGLAAGKFVYVPNGIDVAEWEANTVPLPDEVGASLSRFRKTYPFLVGYAGGHGLSNALDPLIDAAVALRGERVGFVLVGQGPEKARLRARAEQLGLDNILFMDPVSKGAIPALLAGVDAAYIGWLRRPLYRFGVSPNKLFDYMMAERPVIHAVEAGNDLVAESGCGFSVPPEDPAAVVGAVRELMAASPESRREMGARGRRHILAHHTYDVLSARFLEAMRS